MLGKNNQSRNLMNPQSGTSNVVASRSKRRNRKRIVVLSFILAILMVGIGIGSVILIGSRGSAAEDQVTITFNSTGGSEVTSQTIGRGKTIAPVAAPARNGYLFAGWYYEEAPVNAYHAEDVINADTTLYAGWIEPSIEADLQEYIRDCDPNITFVVHSETVLTDENLSEYIRFSCVDVAGDEALSVKPEGDGYLLYSKESLTPGFTYSVEIMDTKMVFFEKAGENIVSNGSIRAYNFTVFRENENHVVKKAEPKLLLSDDVSIFDVAGVVADGQTGNVADNGKTIYRASLVREDIDYQVGDIISLGSGTEDSPENQYYRVVAAVSNSEEHYVDLITPNLEDIYSEMEVYYSGDAVSFEDMEETDEIRAIEQDMQVSLLGSKGYNYLCTSIAEGIKESPTVQSTVATLSESNQKRFAEMRVTDVADLLQNIEVKISMQKTYDITNKENGVRGVVQFSTGDIDIPLDENINLTINLTLTNDITETGYGFISLKENMGVNIYQGATISNHCALNFDAVIGTSNGEKKINITEEIQNLVNSTSKDKTQEIVDSMNQENFFGDDLDYVEIFNKELGDKTVTVYEILTIQFKLNFHVDIGMRVGLNLNFDSTEVRNVGVSNLSGNGIQTINQRVSSSTHFSAILKGQIGVRAGFKAEVNFSVVHLNDLINFGFTIDVGVYEEISGYVRFDYDSTKGSSIAGGLRSETGIYIELDFTWNLFGWQDSLTIATFKFPILTIGALEFASEFAEAENAITFNTSTFNTKISGDQNLLKLKYVDISGGSNGVTINIKPASMSEEYRFFLIKDQTGKGSQEDLQYASIDANTGMITMKENAPERIDFTVVVQYTKGCSLFTKDYQPVTKQIHMTYMKFQVTDSSQKYTAAFYWPDGQVMEQKEYYVGQIPVLPSEDLYEMEMVSGQYKLLSWSRPWKEDIAAIYADTDYHLDYEYNYRNISFIGNVYNETTSKYNYGLIAMIPTLNGNYPTPPSMEAINAEPGWVLHEWSPELFPVNSNYSFSAIYQQDPNYSFYNFYVNNIRVSAGLIKKDGIPVAPDMTKYNTDEQAFYGWWPSLGPATEDYQIYTAVFRKYVKVTFKDVGGKVVNEQKLLAGETPVAPTVSELIEGKEDYYEEKFSHWVDPTGAKLGPVFSDTIFTPHYEKHYLEVTAVFDANGHAFADGTTKKEFTGTYAPFNFYYMPQVNFAEQGKTYTVDYWQSTEMVNGAYVKLYMKSFHADYIYDLTFKPVFKTGVPITYTVRFDGGDETIYLTGQYGDVITADQLTNVKRKSPSVNYTYTLIDYGLPLPYVFGSTLDQQGKPVDYFNVVARFEMVGIGKTITFDANGGAFSDASTQKTVTAPYATFCSFTEVPAKKADNLHTYVFIGWADEKDATIGYSSASFVMNGNITQYAIYSATMREYTVTFDLNGGNIAGVTSPVVQTYHYEDAIQPPSAPARPDDATYRYVFIGWQPVLSNGSTVTANCVYTAEYRAIRIDGELDETGIIVSDGSSFEDICVNSISGYTYAYVGSAAVPTLTITGNGLTFSGTSSDVSVVIEASATEVTFDNLTLAGEYTGNGVLVTAGSDSVLNIHISGACALNNTRAGEQGVRFERPVLFSGDGSGAVLTIGAQGNYTVYCADDIDVNSLVLVVNAADIAIGNDEGSGEEWRFTDSVIRLNAGGVACGTEHSIALYHSDLIVAASRGVYCAGMEVCGASAVDVSVSGESAVAMGTMGDLVFSEFTGSYSARSTHASSPGNAVIAQGNILFKEGGTEVTTDAYNLGGAVVSRFDSEAYASFGVLVDVTLVPATTVTVTKT